MTADGAEQWQWMMLMLLTDDEEVLVVADAAVDPWGSRCMGRPSPAEREAHTHSSVLLLQL